MKDCLSVDFQVETTVRSKSDLFDGADFFNEAGEKALYIEGISAVGDDGFACGLKEDAKRGRFELEIGDLGIVESMRGCSGDCWDFGC